MSKHANLDAAFLQFIGQNPDEHKRIHGYYAPFFAGCRHVVDLACGYGDFVRLLCDQGIPTIGVDQDPVCVAGARAQGCQIIHQDVFEFLEQASSGSLDGIFCAHLVEHLQYDQVLRLLDLAYRALDEGGVIVLATPNPRALYAHLESFYLHYGHISFYHSRLLCFFLDHAGFSNPCEGENPRLAHPLWGQQMLEVAEISFEKPLAYDQVFLRPTNNPFRLLSWLVKRWVTHMIVQPYIDRIAVKLNRQIKFVNDTLARLAGLDRSVECFAVATKGHRQIHIPQE